MSDDGTTSKQPEALALAARMEKWPASLSFPDVDDPQTFHMAGWTAHRAAKELRRLHQSEREGWRYADELEIERKTLMRELDASRKVNEGLMNIVKDTLAQVLKERNEQR